MRKWIVLSVVLVLVLTACNGGLAINVGGVQGSGKMSSETRALEGVSQVELASFGELTVLMGDKEEIVIEAEDNILPLITTNVTAGKLVISTRPNTSIGASQRVRYTLTVKSMDTLVLAGSGNIKVVGTLKGRDVTVKIAGSGDITIEDVQASDLFVDISGSGSVDVRGKADTLLAEINGSGSTNGSDLESRSAKAHIFGSGDIHVWVTEALDVIIDGSGNVEYFGNPSTLTQSTPGSGNIISRGAH